MKTFYTPRSFEFGNEYDEADLVAWSNTHWENTIKKSIDSQNPVIYHDCCFCFSRRGFNRSAGHSRLQSFSVMKLSSLKEVETNDQFTLWLKARMKEHQIMGRKPIFPTLNCYHHNPFHSDEDDVEAEYLSKRCSELLKEKEESDKRIQSLLNDNRKLHASMKAWMLRYQESLSAKDSSEETLMELFTPKKT